MADQELRFGVYILQDAPFDVLRRRWRMAEELGFDQIWVADHTRDWRSPDGIWFDAFGFLRDGERDQQDQHRLAGGQSDPAAALRC